MTLDVLGLLAACSYALDCVEAELVHVTNNHSKRVAYMSVCIAKHSYKRKAYKIWQCAHYCTITH